MNRRTAALLLLVGSALAAGGCAPSSEQAGEREARAREGPALTPASTDSPDRPAPATAWVIFGADTVVAEVARTDDERAQGLMHRESLAENAGMLFIFPDNTVRSFWMQNTYIPLDIAFLDPDFTVVDIQRMAPMSTEPHMSRAPAMYALEVNEGWFEAHGVRVGDRPRVVFGS